MSLADIHMYLSSSSLTSRGYGFSPTGRNFGFNLLVFP